MLKRVVSSAIIASFFASLSLAAEMSCLQVLEDPGVIEEKTCYTATGISKSEFEQECKDKNKMMGGNLKMSGEMVSQCPSGQIGVCKLGTPGALSTTIAYYDASNAEQLPKSCKMIGGEWQSAK